MQTKGASQLVECEVIYPTMNMLGASFAQVACFFKFCAALAYLRRIVSLRFHISSIFGSSLNETSVCNVQE